MGAWLKRQLDGFIDFPSPSYIIGIVISTTLWFLLSSSAIAKLVENSVVPMAGVVFSLFGFAITAVSIMASIKSTPFFDSLQQNNPQVWIGLINSFLNSASIYAILGLYVMFFSKDDILSTFIIGFLQKSAFSFLYILLFTYSILFTFRSTITLKIVVQAPNQLTTIQPVSNPFPNSSGSQSGGTGII